MNVPLAQIVNYDPCIEGLGEKKPCDLVVCIDVMEHIEPESLEDVLKDINALMNKVGYFTIHTQPAMKHLADGRNAHLIQQPYTWWSEKLSKHFWITKMVNMGTDLLFTVGKNQRAAMEYLKNLNQVLSVAGKDQRW